MLGLVISLALAQTPYDSARAGLERERARLARHHDAQARGLARAALLHWVDDVAFPTWRGTAWAFEGMTTTPRTGQIACGYYVSTVLLHAGVRLERIRLSQQSAEHITRSIAAGSQVDVLGAEAEEVIRRARARGEGLYVVGLDNHVGFLRIGAERADFCHASYLGPVEVLCEPALESPAFRSTRFVLADALSDPLVDLWLAGRKLKTIRQ